MRRRSPLSACFLASIVTIAIASCSPAPPANAPPATTTTPRQADDAKTNATSGAKGAAAGGRALRVEVVATAPAVRLSFTASGPPEELASWELGDEVPEKLTLADGAGGTLRGKVSGHTLTIEGRPAKVVVGFELPARVAGEDPLASLVEEARFRVSGEHVAALPAAFAQKPIAI